MAHRPKNVLDLAFSEEQAGYLAGYLAALVLALSPGEEVVSSVGGQRVPSVERWIAGYQAGARGANPRVTTLNTYTDDFLDPVKGRSVALSQIAKGSRVVFQVASTCGLGRWRRHASVESGGSESMSTNPIWASTYSRAR